MQGVLREPLIHFLIGGALLFLLYGWVAGDGDAQRPDRIVVGEERIASLAAGFERTWMRPPTREELEGLVDDFVTEEILYREALGLGLDRDDLVVRRRMRQKMEFLSADLTEREPSEAELSAFLEENAARFREPARVSLRQLFLAPGRPGAPPQERAEALLRQLRGEAAGGADGEPLGDSTLLPERLEAASPRDLESVFGAAFSDAVAAAPVGVWSGPLPSSFGLHLVYVSAREPGRMPSLAESRRSALREWSAARRAEAVEQFERKLRAGYQVEIRIPETAAGATQVSRTP